MIFDWLRDRRRARLLEEPFPSDWLEQLPRWVPVYGKLPAAEQAELRNLVQVFVAEKNWTAAGGLELTDEVRVTIASFACLIILGLPHFLYENVETIIVYPSAVRAPLREPSPFAQSLVPVPNERPALLGEAHLHGPVILVWDAVRRARHPERGHNVVFHEFAHQLDMLDGRADGAPPLHAREDYERYSAVCQREFEGLRRAAERGAPSFLDQYGATNEAEFFAVATEFFFDEPQEMQQRHPDLYEVLGQFYRLDPAAW
ncbi:MAG TPA: M90 family metallopeptidase [Polyangiaceae bacterium]|nr:M90 family metallopeptidase [Polyangiaceae bacterium]